MSTNNILIYLLRRDLRVSDNPILHHLATKKDHGFTHLLPVFVFPAQQMEVSGFIRDGSKSPYPQARSQLGGYWRCGPHRAKFIGEAVWNLKESLETLGSGLVFRVGLTGDVLQSLIEGFSGTEQKIGAVWMTGDEGVEEKREEKSVSSICENNGIEFQTWVDEKYFVDDRDLRLDSPADLPDVFTTYRKQTEPLRERPRLNLPAPEKSKLPPLVDLDRIPPQTSPFTIPDTFEELQRSLVDPVQKILPNLPMFPEEAVSAHPFLGGEQAARDRLNSLVKSTSITNYKETRNGLIGSDFSTKLSAYLAQGCITARQIHWTMVAYEDGTDSAFKQVQGYGEGENNGTSAVRFELLWRDYMRLCVQKFGYKLYRQSGFKGEKTYKWKSASKDHAFIGQQPGPKEIAQIIDRFNRGNTGMGLIDASQRELMHTGYTSNRARQNVASFLAKHLGIDWRYGCEWYEMLLVDYDVASNWANWQYVAGVGNDPRGEARIFNPVKQAFDYDKEGKYVKMWVPEVRKVEKLENVFQAWTTSGEDLERFGIKDVQIVTDPIKKIDFSVDGKPRSARRPFPRRRGQGARQGGDQAGQNGISGNAGKSPNNQFNQQAGQQDPLAGNYNPQQACIFNGNANGNGYRGGYGRGYRGRGGGGGGGGSYRGRGGFTNSRGYRTGGFLPGPDSSGQHVPQWQGGMARM